MSITDIENLLYRVIGLNTSSIGASAVRSAVNERMSVCGLTDLDTYTQRLHIDNNELQELIEEVVVPETWFFRDVNPFKMLARFVTEEWLPSQPEGPLRVLSLPCATGEEPYSIAITLIEAGLMPSQFKIDAFDVSERNLRRCRTARYRSNSFRGVDPVIQQRFFHRHEDSYYPDILIKAMVSFGRASLLDPEFVQTRLPYDVVFCRNLLIYFDRTNQATAADMLDRLLAANGILFVGHAETGIFIGKWPISYRYPKAFALRKSVDDPALVKKIPGVKPQLRTIPSRVKKPVAIKKARPWHRAVQAVPSGPGQRKVSQATQAQPQLAIQDLDQAQQLADAGNFTEAEVICMQYLQVNKQDDRTHFLLGLIQLGAGDTQKAATFFRNAVYLNPKHYDALMYLATLCADQGDATRAAQYHERAQRVKKRNDISGAML